MGENGINPEPHKGDEDHVAAYQTTNMSSDWQVTGNILINTSSIGIDSFCPTVWDPSVNGHNLGYFDTQNIASTSNSLNNPVRGGMNWNPNTMLRNGVFLPTAQGLLPRNLPHFPADTGFIERAARFSCFSGGNLGEMMNPFSFPDSVNHYFRSLGAVYGPNEAFGDHGLKPLNVSDVANDVSLGGVCGNESSPFKNEKKTVSHVRSHDEAKRGVNVSGNESDEAEFGGRNAKEELDGAQEELSDKGLGSNKRKRTGQDLSEPKENNEGQQTSVEKGKSTSEFKEKDEQNSPSTGKSGGKNSKQVPQESDPPKEDYIHIRARRGQATNSHSLAERVRREKISERMKFLQDLVPGCNKVTGKAVMLDEIINYVQSLQRQVEFLSMKLATVNPRLDFNIEGFLAKNILQARAGLSSSMAFHPHDMTLPFPPPHPSLMQAGLPSLATSSETLRRPINLQPSAISGGFKEHTSQMSNSAWEDELHNIVHIGFNSAAALSNQDLCASQLPRHMKPEP